MMVLSQLICYYYLLSLRHWEILMFLKNEDGVNISMSTLCRHLKLLGLFRRKAQSKLKPYGICINGAVDGFSHSNYSHNQSLGRTCNFSATIPIVSKSSELFSRLFSLYGC